MAYPIGAGVPPQSGTFIPALWSGKWLEKFYASSVLTQIANTDYEGMIAQQGDTVNVRQVPDIQIRDYVAGQNLVYERPDSPIVTLLIDKGKYFSPIIDDVIAVQSDLDQMDAWTTDSAEQMKIAVDRDVLSAIPVDAGIPAGTGGNQGLTAGVISRNINLGVTGTPFQVTKVNVLDKLLDLGQTLDEANVPETGRWVVMPAWAIALIKKSDLKDASLSGDATSIMRNGRVGMIDRFMLYSSNLLTPVTDGSNRTFYIIAGHKVGFSFASQITKVETLRAESTFGNILRGLKVYGYKVTKGSALSLLYCYQ
jgi:hypothetical protein